MVGRHIQRIEIMELVFNIRSFGNFKTHFAENRRNFFINFADRMNAPLLFGTNRQRYVNSLSRKLGIKFLGSQLFLSGVKRLLHFRLQNIEVPTLLLFFLDWKAAQTFHQFGNSAFFAQNGHSDFFKGLHVRRGSYRSQKLLFQIIHVFHIFT